MPFPELILRDAPPPVAGLSMRADIALFVGLVARRQNAPGPDALLQALTEAGWAGSGPFARSPDAINALCDVPVPINSWIEFDQLFAWDQRPLSDTGTDVAPCPLGLAVRGFFDVGGIKAYVVRTGDPLPVVTADSVATQIQAKRRLISWSASAQPAGVADRAPLVRGFDGLGVPCAAADPRTWQGAAHIWGVEDAAMLSLPDLADLLSGPPSPLTAPPTPPGTGAEQFVPCAPAVQGFVPPSRPASPLVTAPRLASADYGIWSKILRALLDMLAAPGGAAHRRDVMLCASLPLPSHDTGAVPVGAEDFPLAILDQMDLPAAGQRLTDTAQIGSARLQLGWPWLQTAASTAAPEGLEGPEGRMMGLIARSAITIGAFRSAAGQPVPGIVGTTPALTSAGARRGLDGGRADWLGERLTLIGQRIDTFQLLSDATMAADPAWRAGGVSRLMALILRAARWLGQDRLFEPSRPQMWNALRQDLETFMERLRTAGALDGATPADAYRVRCGPATTSRSDLDQGRLFATIEFTAAQPIERISVTLALGPPGGVTLQDAA